MLRPIHLQTILTSWETGPSSILLYVSVAGVGLAYVLAAARRSPRGRRWPRSRTAWFLAGMALVAGLYGSGLQVYGDDPAVHVVQHMLVMMALPALLVFAAPITLLLRTLSPARRRDVVSVLNRSVVRFFHHHRRAPVLLCLDYYLSMFAYQLTPLRTVTEESPVLHFAVHQYFLVCGLLFWFPIAGLDPVRLRLSERQKQQMIAIGLPAFGVLGAIELAGGDSATGWAYLASGTALTIAGLVLVAWQGRHRAAPAVAPGAAVGTVRLEAAAATGAVGARGERSLSGSA